MSDDLGALRGHDRLDATARAALAEHGRRVRAPADAWVFQSGQAAEAYLLVVRGSVRVQKQGETGREIVLYRVEPGESCVLTTAGLLSGAPYEAWAQAEGEVEAIALPRAVFHRLLGENATFRAFVFHDFSRRLADLLLLVEEVAFGRLDVRLAELLVRQAPAVGPLATTHQALAAELGTAREVVSRQLKEFERRGLVRLGRGQIDVLDSARLCDLVTDTPDTTGAS
ncbi:Crp/Fnr family transcriptional regulator [Myxococcota bacterium]|nr:Crp/Fnr family transcriptional regulator [Myxococcota bacterium]